MIKDLKIHFMKIALHEANKALIEDEVPIGAVIVKDNKVIARGHNKREQKQDILSHAELETIKSANKKEKNWRLVDCDLYVTLEPCLMCMGAIIQSRFKNVYFGAKDPTGGASETAINDLKSKNINHYPHIEGGILEKECSEIISNYFRLKRKIKH